MGTKETKVELETFGVYKDQRPILTGFGPFDFLGTEGFSLSLTDLRTGALKLIVEGILLR